MGGDGGAREPASPSKVNERGPSPRESGTSRKPKESSDQSTHARRPIAAVVTASSQPQMKPPEIRESQEGGGGDGGEHASQRPRRKRTSGAIPARAAIQQKAKGKFGQKHPRKAAHSRRSHSQQSAPDETTEIRESQE